VDRIVIDDQHFGLVGFHIELALTLKSVLVGIMLANNGCKSMIGSVPMKHSGLLCHP